MNMNTIQHRIYNKLIKLVPTLNQLEIGNSMIAVGNPAMMDLHLDILSKKGNEITIALSHYYKHEESGDLIPSPDMQIAVYPSMKTAAALAYQDIYKYQHILINPNAALRIRLNVLLNVWLKNCLRKGYKLMRREKAISRIAQSAPVKNVLIRTTGAVSLRNVLC